MAQYGYSQLENVAVDIIEDAVSLNMKTSGPEEQRSFSFETEKKEDIASLIASYSPVHSNWKRVGEVKTKLVSQHFMTTHNSLTHYLCQKFLDFSIFFAYIFSVVLHSHD